MKNENLGQNHGITDFGDSWDLKKITGEHHTFSPSSANVTNWDNFTCI